MTARISTVGVDELADDLGVGAEWVRQQCRAGRFPHHLIGRRLRFTEQDVAEILAETAKPATPPAATPARPAVRRYASYPAPVEASS